tara:strand:+ start:4 stop:816 length:813 start_codon:yes stop_codon:yes gene_type:complete
MSRKERLGLDFYSIDTDLFFNRKIKRLIKNFGGNGYLIYSFLLTEIYRDKGCFIAWDSNTAFDVSDTINVKETLVNEVVSYCCSVGLFNKELLTNENVLSTKNIQEFWVKVVKGAKRKTTSVPNMYNLLKLPEKVKKEVSTLKAESITVESEFITIKEEESTQRKEKESKVKKSKEEEEEKKNVFFDIKILKEDYLKNDRIVASFCKNQKINAYKLAIFLKEFNSNLEDTGKHSKTFEDYATHFLSWFRKQEAKKPKQSAVDKLNTALGV